MNYFLKGLAAAALSAAAVLPANAGYVTFYPVPGAAWTYYTIYFSSGGISNLAVRAGLPQCQSQLEADDSFSRSTAGIPVANAPRYSMAPFIKDQCD